MGKKIIFIKTSEKRTMSCVTSFNHHDEYFYIDYWDICKDKTRLKYPVNDTIIFSIYDDGDIFVRSRKYRTPSCNFRMHAPEYSLYNHISEAFKIFDDINAKCKSEGKDPVWMLEFDLDDNCWSAVFNVALTRLFNSFTLTGSACETAITTLYRDYHPEALYNMMVKNLTRRDHEDQKTFYRLQEVDKDDPNNPFDYWPKSLLTKEVKAHYDKMFITACRGNGKTALMQEQLYGIKGGSKMDKIYNFRKNIKEIRRDKKNPGKFLIDSKDGFLSREIVCDGFSKKELYSEEFIETILVIATQIQYDGIIKVIFNKKEKLTIIFPHNSYNFSERIIVKANGLDTFDILNGYSIAKAKMLCSGDGYQWYNRLRKSGKVDV